MSLFNLLRELIKDSFLKWILLLNLIVYVPIIFIIPDFILDDYYLFYIISQNPGVPVSTNPGEAFFLFMRPLSYLSFWFDYNIFNANPLSSKILSLFLHIALVIVFYLLLKKITYRVTKKNEASIIFLITLIYSFHLDNSIWNYWISNRTELLAVIFYLLSISAFVKFISTHRNKYLFLCALFYLASITSKQTGLHLPVLLLFLVYIAKWEYKADNRTIMKIFFSLGIFMMLIYSSLNYFIYESDLNFSQGVWKKPFAFIGNFIHVIIPYHSQSIYNYFLINKPLSIILLGVFVIVLILLLIMLKKEKTRLILSALVFVLIIMFPRILAVAEPRINGIIVFWILVVLTLGMYKLKKIVSLTLLALILVYSLITLSLRIGELKNNIDSYDRVIANYINTVNRTAKHDFVVISENNFTLNYQAYYRIHNTFGLFDGVLLSPLFYDVSLVYFDSEQYRKPFILVHRFENEFNVESLNDLVFLSIDKRRIKDYYIFEKIIPQYKSREYRQINFKLGSSFPVENYSMIYFNGVDWITLE